MSIEQELQDNMKYQRWLAESLVANLGYDRAVKTCLQMCWYGTLDFLVKEKDGHVLGAPEPSAMLTDAA